VGALVYENQFIQFTTQLPSTYLYGFGENTHSRLRHSFEPRNTWPIFARDQPVGTVSYDFMNFSVDINLFLNHLLRNRFTVNAFRELT
jgi:hypothetical protein